MDTILFVIIDQMGWADCGQFRSLTRLLGEPRKVTTPYFPTVTETAHASVSVASPPKTHGIIGGESLVESGGGQLRLVQVDESVFQSRGYGDGTPFEHNFTAGDAECFVVAGKRKVAQLLCPEPLRPRTLTRVTFERSSGNRLCWSIQTSRRDTPILPDCSISELDDPDSDSLLIRAAATLLDCAAEFAKNRVLLLCLPRLDAIGHWNDRDSRAIVETLQRLDRELTDFLSLQFEGQECAVVVVGDHGWRPVDTAIWFSNHQVNCLKLNGERTQFNLPDGIRTYGREGKPAILCDGGTVRIWTQEGQENGVARWLNDALGEYLTDVRFRPALEAFLEQHGSAHTNWGQVVGFAKENAALCKPGWVEHTDGKVCVPVAEHGSDFERDLVVPMWTRNVNASQAIHTEFGRHVAELLQSPDQ